MLDLKRVREDLQGTINRLETRGGDFSYLNKITELDEQRKNIILEVEQFFSRYLATAPEAGDKVLEHLLDGQQRLTALWRALNNNYEDVTYFLYLNSYDENVVIEDKTKETEIWLSPRWKNKKGSTMPLWVDVPQDCFKRGLIPMNLFLPGDNAKR